MDSHPTTAKKPVNVSINSELLRQAKELKINVSQVLEMALTSQVKRLREEQWKADNQEAIEAYNRHVQANGIWNDAWHEAMWTGKVL